MDIELTLEEYLRKAVENSEHKVLECSNEAYPIALQLTEGTNLTVKVNDNLSKDHWVIISETSNVQ